ncbi:DUF4276 family protein [Aquisphaera insulae]|uniref:DUF4276 family protein n=1 Tax=Aquisphaera insulae TaxID=2712864 RepID=UPI00196AA4E5|nr:DUF4276 family protein [Aquisphaera insulae]
MFVTGDGEREFLHALFRPLTRDGHCHFEVVHQLGQLSPIRSTGRQARMLGSGKKIANRDEDIGLKARRYLNDGFDFVLLVDDLEQARSGDADAVYERYRTAFDVMLRPVHLEARASVHFLVNMIEAYYFGDAAAINQVLGTQLNDHEGDVETIPHPKNQLKGLVAALGPDRKFDEVEHGRRILEGLDIAKVLSRPETCRSLRTAFAWCQRAKGQVPTDEFQLSRGELSTITRDQLDLLPAVPR